MPCKDITENLKILLDSNDHLLKYALRKKTCQGEVGKKSLLLKYLKNKSAQTIINTPLEQVIRDNPNKSNTWEYLTVKHFLTVKAALEVYSGETSGSVNDFCTIDSIEYEENSVLILAEISIDGITKEIEACGGCATCAPAIKS